MNSYEFFPDGLRKSLPPLYHNEEIEDPIIWCKFFTPDSNWNWYVLEFDGSDRLFGLVEGFEVELGYFSLSELEAVRGPLNLPIERDIHFKPTKLSIIRENIKHRRG